MASPRWSLSPRNVSLPKAQGGCDQADTAGAGAGTGPLAGWGARLGVRRQAERLLALVPFLAALPLPLARSLTHTGGFSSQLAADTPRGAVSWGRGGRKPEPLTLENKPKQPRRLMTQYTSGSRGPFPLGWAGAGRRRDTDRENAWLPLAPFPWELRTKDYFSSRRRLQASKPLLNQAPKERLLLLEGRLQPLVGLPARGARLLQSSHRLYPAFQEGTDGGWQRTQQSGRGYNMMCGFTSLRLGPPRVQ